MKKFLHKIILSCIIVFAVIIGINVIIFIFSQVQDYNNLQIQKKLAAAEEIRLNVSYELIHNARERSMSGTELESEFIQAGLTPEEAERCVYLYALAAYSFHATYVSYSYPVEFRKDIDFNTADSIIRIAGVERDLGYSFEEAMMILVKRTQDDEYWKVYWYLEKQDKENQLTVYENRLKTIYTEIIGEEVTLISKLPIEVIEELIRLEREHDTQAKPELITAEELLQYIEDNDVGLTEEDFEGVNIDDFIVHWHINNENLSKFILKNILESYRDYIQNKQNFEFVAKELISINSTDEEFDAFIILYFKAIGKESNHLGKYKTSVPIEVYEILDEDDRYVVWIGKTEIIEQFQIKETAFGLEIFIPEGMDNSFGSNHMFCYNKDNKFFLIINPYDDYDYELALLFTQTGLN
ncbi:MAG: hypothetical protein FWD34_06470 [Oscillospiraceae bacterium]|nr:hypothetical protein [Oscillospiraceae bacterium]